MKALFEAIRHGETDEVIRILERHPELLDTPSTAPPKKDEGQSPLQVAVKTGRIDIADYLIRRGADVNYMESGGEQEKAWHAPVIQDAVISVFTACCHGDYDRSRRTLEILRSLLERGAEPNKPDSFGRIAWDVAGSQLVQVLCPPYSAKQQNFARKQAREVFGLLLEHGSRIVEPSYLPAISVEAYRTFMEDFFRSRKRGSLLDRIFHREKL